jgi:hypothetical protein
MASRLYQPIILDSQQMANYHKRMNVVNRFQQQYAQQHNSSYSHPI